jgi:GDPmannose 4,6-dehydratase
MHLMLARDTPEDFVVGTGVTHSVGELVELTFSVAGLDWRDHVVCDAAYVRPAEVDELCADASKAAKQLGWEPTVGFDELVTMMVESDLALLAGPGEHDDDAFGPEAW